MSAMVQADIPLQYPFAATNQLEVAHSVHTWGPRAQAALRAVLDVRRRQAGSQHGAHGGAPGRQRHCKRRRVQRVRNPGRAPRRA